MFLLLSRQRPTVQYREYRPSSAEIWSTATDAASASLLPVRWRHRRRGERGALCDEAKQVVDEASTRVQSALSSPAAAEDPVASAIAGFKT